MIVGYAKVADGAVITHKDSFLLSSISVVSVRRPFLATALVLSIGLTGFAASFIDLLFNDELIKIASCIATLMLMGLFTAQLTLLSRDLKGSELSSAVWGTKGSLQKIRREIVREVQEGSAKSGANHMAGTKL